MTTLSAIIGVMMAGCLRLPATNKVSTVMVAVSKACWHSLLDTLARRWSRGGSALMIVPVGTHTRRETVSFRAPEVT